ncbi:hypothetical protein GMRT_11846 [Giardia muris]|uniref:Uncharacterized protein n=1 Tax=Giardia muris TaxID=5742 RepID=A0A4Z1STA7_GIAMU|nr:hypothetical protein GMRT_11846 [Giardia muris]|eukprot:TNJ28980.1 hypothetical protein GMRT_11846 [Giardia muris]
MDSDFQDDEVSFDEVSRESSLYTESDCDTREPVDVFLELLQSTSFWRQILAIFWLPKLVLRMTLDDVLRNVLVYLRIRVCSVSNVQDVLSMYEDIFPTYRVMNQVDQPVELFRETRKRFRADDIDPDKRVAILKYWILANLQSVVSGIMMNQVLTANEKDYVVRNSVFPLLKCALRSSCCKDTIHLVVQLCPELPDMAPTPGDRELWALHLLRDVLYFQLRRTIVVLCNSEVKCDSPENQFCGMHRLFGGTESIDCPVEACPHGPDCSLCCNNGQSTRDATRAFEGPATHFGSWNDMYTLPHDEEGVSMAMDAYGLFYAEKGMLTQLKAEIYVVDVIEKMVRLVSAHCRGERVASGIFQLLVRISVRRALHISFFQGLDSVFNQELRQVFLRQQEENYGIGRRAIPPLPEIASVRDLTDCDELESYASNVAHLARSPSTFSLNNPECTVQNFTVLRVAIISLASLLQNSSGISMTLRSDFQTQKASLDANLRDLLSFGVSTKDEMLRFLSLSISKDDYQTQHFCAEILGPLCMLYDFPTLILEHLPLLLRLLTKKHKSISVVEEIVGNFGLVLACISSSYLPTDENRLMLEKNVVIRCLFKVLGCAITFNQFLERDFPRALAREEIPSSVTISLALTEADVCEDYLARYHAYQDKYEIHSYQRSWAKMSTPTPAVTVASCEVSTNENNVPLRSKKIPDLLTSNKGFTSSFEPDDVRILSSPKSVSLLQEKEHSFGSDISGPSTTAIPSKDNDVVTQDEVCLSTSSNPVPGIDRDSRDSMDEENPIDLGSELTYTEEELQNMDNKLMRSMSENYFARASNPPSPALSLRSPCTLHKIASCGDEEELGSEVFDRLDGVGNSYQMLKTLFIMEPLTLSREEAVKLSDRFMSSLPGLFTGLTSIPYYREKLCDILEYCLLTNPTGPRVEPIFLRLPTLYNCENLDAAARQRVRSIIAKLLTRRHCHPKIYIRFLRIFGQFGPSTKDAEDFVIQMHPYLLYCYHALLKPSTSMEVPCQKEGLQSMTRYSRSVTSPLTTGSDATILAESPTVGIFKSRGKTSVLKSSSLDMDTIRLPYGEKYYIVLSIRDGLYNGATTVPKVAFPHYECTPSFSEPFTGSVKYEPFDLPPTLLLAASGRTRRCYRISEQAIAMATARHPYTISNVAEWYKRQGIYLTLGSAIKSCSDALGTFAGFYLLVDVLVKGLTDPCERARSCLCRSLGLELTEWLHRRSPENTRPFGILVYTLLGITYRDYGVILDGEETSDVDVTLNYFARYCQLLIPVTIQSKLLGVRMLHHIARRATSVDWFVEHFLPALLYLGYCEPTVHLALTKSVYNLLRSQCEVVRSDVYRQVMHACGEAGDDLTVQYVHLYEQECGLPLPPVERML